MVLNQDKMKKIYVIVKLSTNSYLICPKEKIDYNFLKIKNSTLYKLLHIFQHIKCVIYACFFIFKIEQIERGTFKICEKKNVQEGLNQYMN